MRCSCCGVVLTRGEMSFDLPDGSMNDICWSCQPFIDEPEFCDYRTYQLEDITEVPFPREVTPVKPLND